MIAVLAGTHAQYRAYLREHRLSPTGAVHCYEVDRMRGIRFASFVRVGSWFELPDRVIELFAYLEATREGVTG